jgi:IS5 family transposase
MFRRDQKQRQLTFADLSNAAQAVPQDHILIRMRESVRWESVEQELKGCYAEGSVGRPGWSPAKLVRMLLLQEYADLSDRDVEEQVGYNLLYRAFVGLSAEDWVPDDTTLVRFRTRIGTEGMRRVFAEVNRQWEAAGLIGAERRAVDGVHLWARVVRRSWAQLVGHLRGELVAAVLRQEGPARAEELQRCATLTDPERKLRGEERVKAEIARTEQLLQATASVQGVAVAQARERLQQVLQNVGQVSLVDPDARWGHKKEDQPFLGYKAHQAMDPESRIITAVDVVPGNQNEAVQMTALLAQETTTLGPESVVIGDGLYDNATTRKQVEEYPAKLCAAGRRTARVSDQFQYDPTTNTLVCPAGKRSQSQTIQDQGTLYRFSQKDCGPCPLRDQCLTQGEQDPKGKPRRRVYLSDAHRAKLAAGTAGKAWRREMLALRRRIEPKFDEQANQHGLRGLRFWGRLKATLQVLTNALMVNMKRAAKLLDLPPPTNRSPQRTEPCPA